MESYAFDSAEHLAVELLHVPVVGYVDVKHLHLPAAYACADVAHPVVVAYFLVLVIRIAFAGLCGEEFYAACRLVVFAHQRASS